MVLHCLFKVNVSDEHDVDLNKCLKQVKLPISLYMRASISELPSNISTMLHSVIFDLKNVHT